MIRLSLCIATFNRSAFIAQTLDVLLAQMSPGIELVVVDGASTDGTGELMEGYAQRYPSLVYRRESTNSGVDQDFDKAVGYARGSHCWLMSDDDLILPGAIQRVVDALRDDPALLIVNAEVRTRDLRRRLRNRLLAMCGDADYAAADSERFFTDAGAYLSFIGCVVVRRSTWIGRERAAYYGTLFIHVGVIFQLPALDRIRILAEPLVAIRYGNAMWTARGFEIWNCKWPKLVWSFTQFSEKARTHVSTRHPTASLKTLLWFRSLGAYGMDEYKRFVITGQAGPIPWHARWVAKLPANLVNLAMAIYCFADPRAESAVKLFDVSLASCAGRATRLMARLRGL